jgi:hypothetical protein
MKFKKRAGERRNLTRQQFEPPWSWPTPHAFASISIEACAGLCAGEVNDDHPLFVIVQVLPVNPAKPVRLSKSLNFGWLCSQSYLGSVLR